MRDGLRVSFALNEFVTAAVCVTIIVCTVGFLYTHPVRPAAPVPTETCKVKEPTITIEQTYFIPVPAPKVTVVVPEPKKKEYNGEDDGDYAAPEVKPQRQADPVFQHRTPIITQALQQPITRN